MSSVHDLLDDLAVIGATIQPAANRLILRAGAAPVPADLISRVRRAKAELLPRIYRSAHRDDAWPIRPTALMPRYWQWSR
jgi:hypothetical protein